MTDHIEHPEAYANAVKRNIIANARTTWMRTHADAMQILDYLICGSYDEETGRMIVRPHAEYANGRMVEGETFLSKMAYSLETYGKLTDKQTEAVRKCIQKDAERKAAWKAQADALDAARQHLGTVGGKIDLELTIKRVVKIQGMSFGYYDSGITYLYIMEDSQRNVVTYKGNSNAMPVGDVAGVQLKLRATVKEHGVYQNTKQTVIQRPKRLDAPVTSA